MQKAEVGKEKPSRETREIGFPSPPRVSGPPRAVRLRSQRRHQLVAHLSRSLRESWSRTVVWIIVKNRLISCYLLIKSCFASCYFSKESCIIVLYRVKNKEFFPRFIGRALLPQCPNIWAAQQHSPTKSDQFKSVEKVEGCRWTKLQVWSSIHTVFRSTMPGLHSGLLSVLYEWHVG